MKKTRVILFIWCLSFILTAAFSQTKTIDSLRRNIEKAVTGKEKLAGIIKLSEQSLNPDTLLPYVQAAEAIALKTNDKFSIDQVRYMKAGYYVRKNYIDSSLHITDSLLADYKNDRLHQKFYLGLLFFKSKTLDRGNRYTQALTQLYSVVQTAEACKDTLIQIQAKTGIGWVQMEMEQYKEALQWLQDALHTSADKKFYKNYGALYSNLASTHNALGNTDSATYYINAAIRDARENDNLLFLATALNIQAKIFIDSKQAHLAEAPLQEAVAIRKKLNDPFYTVYDMSSLASYYANNNQAVKGIELCKEGIGLAKRSGLSSQLLMMYHSLAANYKASGNTVEYSKTLEAIIALKDSFNNINSAKLLADMQAGSDVLKKERTIAEQKLTLTVKNYWLFGSALFIVMVAIIIWLAFKNYRRKQNIKMQLALQEEKRIAAQSIIDAEEQERKRIAADLHDNIGAYASAIRADVEKIADNGLEKNSSSLQNLQQHSQEIINSLRDTIWVLNKDNITITGIGDRIKNYINKLRPSYNNIQFHITEDVSNNVRINSQNALNIFRIVQEALHNALKHSRASNVSIDIVSNETFRVKISDDGEGMQHIGEATGNGLRNMQARAREIGMQLSIVSGVNEGTVLLLTNTTIN